MKILSDIKLLQGLKKIGDHLSQQLKKCFRFHYFFFYLKTPGKVRLYKECNEGRKTAAKQVVEKNKKEGMRMAGNGTINWILA